MFKNGTKQSTTAYIKKDEIVLVLVAVIFGMTVAMAKIAADDYAVYSSIESSLKGCWKWAVSVYYSWSSRVLINFIWAVVLKKGQAAWALYMVISAYILMKGLKLLSSGDKNNGINFAIVCLLLLFPSELMISAGWIATTTSYFGPQAFAVMALVPIKKIIRNEKIGIVKKILYALCLVYAANAEQTCVALLGIYCVAALYLFLTKRNSWFIWIQFVLTIVSFVFMMTCPGNWGRNDAETITHFPTYGMLGIIDKAEIGVSTTLHWMFAEGKLLVIFVCLVMTFAVWKKYSESLYRMIVLIPVSLITIFGPFRNILGILFPSASKIANSIDIYGEFTVSANGIGIGMIQFGVFLIIAVCIVIEIILLNDTVDGLVADLTIIVMGFGSRVMMGFSPTVYASSVRTYSQLAMYLMVVAVHILSNNIENFETKEIGRGKYAMFIIAMFGYIDVVCRVATEFY